jgi:Ca-activated chloride channel family protein
MPDPNHAASPFQLLLTPERAALAAGGANTVRVLVRVRAPAQPANVARRDPLHLALVLDRSGSMAGAPLDEAKRCARHIVEQLGADDRAAIVAFDSEVEVMAAAMPASEKAVLRAAIDGIVEAGSTNLHGGWRAGADELAGKLAAEGIHRVVLLSDGGANAGETALEVISGQCRDLARAGVSTSTYGLGDHFNEDLMLAMARAGRGNAYYGDTAADLAEPFAAEFALLTNLCARGLVLKVNAPDGVGVRLLNDYDVVDGGTRAWKLPDLAYAAEAWAVVEFALPAGTIGALDAPGAGGAGTAAGAAAGGGADAGPTGRVTLPITVSLEAAGRDSAPVFLMAALPPLPVVSAAGLAAMPADQTVERRVVELEAAAMLDELRAAIEVDNWERAQRLLADAQVRFAAHEWASAILATMRKLVAERDAQRSMKEARYAGSRMANRLVVAGEENLSMAQEDALPLYLQRKGAQGKGRRT